MHKFRLSESSRGTNQCFQSVVYYCIASVVMDTDLTCVVHRSTTCIVRLVHASCRQNLNLCEDWLDPKSSKLNLLAPQPGLGSCELIHHESRADWKSVRTHCTCAACGLNLGMEWV